MKGLYIATVFLLVVATTMPLEAGREHYVQDRAEFDAAVSAARPGDQVVLAGREWVDTHLRFQAHGTAQDPIVLRAETPGETILTGSSSLWIGGSHLVVEGLYFREGALPPGDTAMEAYVVRFLPGSRNCRLTNSVIVDYNPPDINQRYFWVGLQGQDHRVDHNFLSGQNHRGVTIVVFLAGEPARHRIDNNFIGNRPPGNGNGFEAMTIGRTAADLLVEAQVTVERNLFYRCSGEGEIISNKSSGNRFIGNTFVKSQGALVFRQGNGSVADGNFFFGAGKEGCGGIRVHGGEHLIMNNYFDSLTLPSITLGNADASARDDDDSNVAYRLVRDCLIAHNTSVNHHGHDLEFGVFANSIDAQGNQLYPDPPRENTFANNVFWREEEGGGRFVNLRSTPEETTWEGNVHHGATLGMTPPPDGIALMDPQLALSGDSLWRPKPESPLVDAAEGDHPRVTHDMDGQPRGSRPDIGADELSDAPITRGPLGAEDVGPDWFDPPARAQASAWLIGGP